MAYYRDLREHIKALEARGKLVRIEREINKDTALYKGKTMTFMEDYARRYAWSARS